MSGLLECWPQGVFVLLLLRTQKLIDAESTSLIIFAKACFGPEDIKPFLRSGKSDDNCSSLLTTRAPLPLGGDGRRVLGESLKYRVNFLEYIIMCLILFFLQACETQLMLDVLARGGVTRCSGSSRSAF